MKAFKIQCCRSESGIRCFFDPWIRDGKKFGSGINIPDHFSRELRNKQFLWLKILKFFLTWDPGWKNSDPE
jgi:hypothetical protein